MFEHLDKLGYAIIQFKDLNYLYKMQNIISAIFPNSPTDFHKETVADETRLALVSQARNEILKNELIKKFILANTDFLVKLLGPDIDIQTDFYLRVSRPNLESDFIDWHRDTFYGNSFWELNFWFPLFPLAENAGLMIMEGSHLEAANNVHSIPEKDNFRSQVTKGSLANELGYLYAPKSDDTISNPDPKRIKLITPELGQGIIFFTHAAHRAHNASIKTRVSADLRIKNMFAPTHTRPGYFQPLLRGVMTSCVEKIIAMNAVLNTV